MKNKKRKKLNLKSVILIVLVVLIVLILLLKLFVFNNSTNKYGNRLESIKNIKIEEKDKSKITNALKENAKVSKVSVDIKGKIVNIIVEVADDTSKDDAVNLANSTLDQISDNIKGAYDIQIFISKKSNDKDNEFPMIGYKNVKSNKFVW